MAPVLVADTDTGPVELGPTLSIFDPVHIGIDEFGHPVRVPMIYKNMLIGGEPGAGKSALLNAVVAHAVLSLDCRLCLLDGKQVELGQWRRCADVFVGPDITRALSVLKRLQIMMDNRYAYLLDCERRKIAPVDTFQSYLIAIDEIAYFSATIGDKRTREDFAALLRDLVARGRAVGIIVIAATQRPSADIIPTSLRDLFAWRFAGRCTTNSSSDIILGQGWAQQGWSANTISPGNPGAGLLIAEGGSPQMVKVAYLDDRTCAAIAAYAAALRATVTAADRPALRPVPAAA
ncbi:MAG TPA: FtsK/SpoIIIE domain-containing protein [Actinoplanes sp.]|jgi:S-DNA-T family DNA segregation ATPase FtsK/SpoIIIE